MCFGDQGRFRNMPGCLMARSPVTSQFLKVARHHSLSISSSERPTVIEASIGSRSLCAMSAAFSANSSASARSSGIDGLLPATNGQLRMGGEGRLLVPAKRAGLARLSPGVRLLLSLRLLLNDG